MTKKEIIVESAARLIAEHSYDSVSIRQIAKEADVNSAMISYYFGGKIGLLREIFSQFATLTLSCVTTAFARSANMNELSAHTPQQFLTSARANRNVYIVGLKEFNRGRHELNDLNQELRDQSMLLFSAKLEEMGIADNTTDDESDMHYTAIMGIIFSDYLLGGGAYIDNDANFETYMRVVTTILQNGAPSLWE